MQAEQPSSPQQLPPSPKRARTESGGDVDVDIELNAGEVGSCFAYFRVFDLSRSETEGTTFWYRFNVGGGEDGIGSDDMKSPTLLHPFSVTNQRPSSTTVGLGSKLYCFGGGYAILGEKESCNAVTCLDTCSSSTKEWKNMRPMLAGRINPLALVVNGKIYVFGGIQGNDVNDTSTFEQPGAWAEFYDPLFNRWESLSVPENVGAGKTWQELLNSEYDADYPLDSFPVSVLKMDDRRILMFALESSFIYDIQENTLATLECIIPFWFFYSPQPPVFMDDRLYQISESEEYVLRYNVSKRGQFSGYNLSKSDQFSGDYEHLFQLKLATYSPEDPDPIGPFFYPFRTDGLPSSCQIRKSMHLLRNDWSCSEIYSYTAGSPAPEGHLFPETPKYKYFSLDLHGDINGCGILLWHNEENMPMSW